MESPIATTVDEMKSKLALFIRNASPDKIKALYTLFEQDIEAASKVTGDDYDKLEEEFLALDEDNQSSQSWEQVKKEGLELLKSLRDDKE